MFSALLLLVASSLTQDSAPARQFDFWAGEWSVQNRNLQEDNTWKDGDVTKARITPVCDGMALLEEWAGPFHGGFMNGFSLRSFDPVLERWTILLFWTMDGNASFGRMHGSFRHGRGEFFSTMQGPKRTRFSFSDGLANSLRWDQARTTDGGRNWSTDWIMEFSRTRAAAATTQDRFFEVNWTEGEVSPHKEARALDWMRGEWIGEQIDCDGVTLQARLRCKNVNKDCLLVDLLETRLNAEAPWQQRLTVRGFGSGKKTWSAWSLASDAPVMRRSAVQAQAAVRHMETDPDEAMQFEMPWSKDVAGANESILLEKDGSLTWVRHTASSKGEWALLDTTRLKRVE